MTKNELLIRIQNNPDLSGLDLSGIKLSELDLVGVNFTRCILKKKLTSANQIWHYVFLTNLI